MTKVLVVEDNPVLNTAYQRILETHGHTVTTAKNGKEALEKTAAEEPEIIFLDLLMPEMGGVEFLKAYDLKNKHPGVYVIVISNLDSDKEIEEARKLGASKYILKAHASPTQLAVLVDKAASQNLAKES